MSITARVPRNAINALIVFFLLTNAFAPTLTVSASTPNQQVEPISQMDTTSMKYGNGWNSQTLPTSVTVPLLSDELAAQSNPPEKEISFLKVSVNPEIYMPGKPVQLHWKVEGYKPKSGQEAEITVKASPRITPLDSAFAATYSEKEEVRLPADNGTQGMDWTVAADAERPFYLYVAFWLDGQVIDEQVVELGEAKFTVEKGRAKKIDGLGGKAHLDIPGDALEQSLVFDVRRPSPHRTPAISPSGNPIEIIAADQNSGQSVTRFKKPVTLQIQYSEDQIFDWNEESLQLFYYSEEDGDWMPMATTVDPETNTLTVQTDHLTVFDYKASTWQKYSTPTIDNFQVSDFTGAGSYAIQLWTPPGSAGLQPDLTLTYNSQVIDEASAYSQASWVGMGWTLDTPSIARNSHETEKKTATGQEQKDDTFVLNINGSSHTLLPETGTYTTSSTFRTVDETFQKITFDYDAEKWVVYGKDGTQYVFSGSWRQSVSFNGCANDPLDFSNDMRWMLSSVTDVHGNTMTYTYKKELKKETPGTTSTTCIDNVAIYPETIVYGNGNYQVHFILDDTRRGDFQKSWTTSTALAMYSTYRLKYVQIEQKRPGETFQPIRKYEFTYANSSNNAEQIFPDFTWTGSSNTDINHTLTLIGLQEMNGIGDLPQPKVKFSYGDQMHLTGVDNGQGGRVEIQYALQPLLDNVNPKARAQYNYFSKDDCASGATLTWKPTSTSYTVRCDGYIHYLQVGTGSALGKGYHALPEHIAKLGGHYRAYVHMTPAQQATSLKFGLYNTALASSLYLTLPTSVYNQHYYLNQEIELPAAGWDLTKTRLQIECGKGCFIPDIQFSLMPYFYRAEKRVITDEVTHTSSEYTYSYDNPSTNNVDTSAAVVAANNATGNTSYTAPHKEYSTTLYRYPNREYRGNAMTQVINSENLATVNWYYQTDELKGRSYRTLSMRRDFYDDMERDVIGGEWVPVPASGKHSIPSLQNLYDAAQTAKKPLVDYDRMLQSANPAADWSVALQRNASLTDGKAAIAHVRLSGDGNTQAEVGLVSASGQFFGVSLVGDGTNTKAYLNVNGAQGEVLIDAFQRDEWYAVMLWVDSAKGMRVKLWQLDQPETSGEAGGGGYAGETWSFRERINKGTLALDAYTEGEIYTESETLYASAVQKDPASLAYPDLRGFKDLSIVWSYPTGQTQRVYDGHSSWYGTRQVYAYDQGDQNNVQYGNLTRTIYEAWDGQKWVAHHAAHARYWPKNDVTIAGGTYRVSLPARQTTLDCTGEGGCDFIDDERLLGETLSFYGQDSYALPPATGELTRQRTLVDDTNKRYSQVDYGYANHNLHTTTVYGRYADIDEILSTGDDPRTTTVDYDPVFLAYPVQETNPLGQATASTYDTAAGQPNAVTDANGNTTTATYDGLGRLTEIRAPGDEGVTATLAVTYQPYAAGQPFAVRLEQKLDDKHTMESVRYYSGTGKLVQSQSLNMNVEGEGQAVNVVTATIYDNLGRAVQQSKPFYYPYTGATSAAYQALPAGAAVTTTEYDARGRAWRVSEPNGNQATTRYDGLSVTQVDAKGNTTTTTSDVWGQVVGVTPADGPGLAYGYDVAGRLTEVRKGENEAATTTTMEYDFTGRKTGMDDPDMGQWHYRYDALGNLYTQTDARGCVTTLSYDALNRLTGKSYGETCPNTTPVRYFYDGTSFNFLGSNYQGGANLIGQRTGMTDGSGATLWAYDARGRKLSETKMIYSDEAQSQAESFVTAWTYNSADLPVSMTYPDGEVVNLGYNTQGSLASLTGTATYVKSVVYDEAGRVTALDYGDAGGAPVLQRSSAYYDWTDSTNGGKLHTLVTGSLQNLTYEYDRNSNITSLVDGVNGETSSFTYDSLNRLLGTNVNGTGGITVFSEAFTYDPDTGRMATKQKHTDPVTTLQYDPNHKHAVSAFGSNSYGYDLNGNQVERVIGGATYSLTYDAENHLVAVYSAGQQGLQTPEAPTAEPIPTEEITLEATPTEEPVPTETSLPEITETPGLPEADFLSAPESGESPQTSEERTATEEPTVEPQQTEEATATPEPAATEEPTPTPEVTEPAVPTAEETQPGQMSLLQSEVNAHYWYDGDGTLVKGEINGVVTYYAGRHYHKRMGAGEETIQKFYFAGSMQVAVRTLSGGSDTLNWILSDHLGSTNVTANADGTLLSEMRYTAFGEVRQSNGTTETPYQYTGQLSQMEEIRLQYFVARWFDPAIAHFIQADTIVPELAKAAAYDRFAYGLNNPIEFNDPSGHCYNRDSNGNLTSTCKEYWSQYTDAIIAKYFSIHTVKIPDVPIYQQPNGASCGQAAFTMAWNYVHQDIQLDVNSVFSDAYNQGFYETQPPWTSPAHMVDMGNYYATLHNFGQPKSGNVNTNNEIEAMEHLSTQLSYGDPLIVDVTIPLGVPESSTHFVVITGLEEENGKWYVVYNDPIFGGAGERKAEWASLWTSWSKNTDQGGQGWWMIVK